MSAFSRAHAVSVSLALAAVAALAVGESPLVMPPLPGATGPDVAVVFVHGAEIANTQYHNLFAITQKQAYGSFRLWVGLPAFTLELPNPLEIASACTEVLNNMTTMGLPAGSPVVYAGHSLVRCADDSRFFWFFVV